MFLIEIKLWKKIANVKLINRYHSIFFVRVGYETTYAAKGQLTSKCPYDKSVSSKIPKKIFPRFLHWKFTTSRLTKRESMFCLQEDRLCFVVTLN